MFRNLLTAVLASTALAAAPALAGPGGGGGGGHGGGPGGGAGVGNGGGAGAMGGGPSGAALDARLNSMGPANASQTGIDHANPNSVLGTNSATTARTNGRASVDSMFPGTKGTSKVQSGALTGLTTGMSLTSNGTQVGTVQQIRSSSDGTVRVVVVQGTNGRLFAVPANKLTLDNGVLTTTARLNGINGGNVAGTNPAIGVSQGPFHASPTGIAHANAHSVLSSAGTANLSGLATGTAVFNGTGTQIGSVSRIQMSNSGTIARIFVTTTSGRTLSLSPGAFTLDANGNLTTSAKTHG